MMDGLGPHCFVGRKTDSVIPGIAASQDFLEVFLESEFGVGSGS